MLTLIERFRHLIVGAFFIGIFVIGISIFKDYGVHCDEYNNQHFGERWTNYIYNTLQTGSLSKSFPAKLLLHDLIHGPFIEISLTFIKDCLHLKDSRAIILLRHFIIFIIFLAGSIIFYLFCLRHFKDWKLAILGTFFLILSPRQFSHAFYNTVDIGFLALFTLAMFSIVLFLEKKNYLRASLLALSCALASDVRFIGILSVLFTIFFILIEYKEKKQLLRNLMLLSYFVLLYSLFFILFFPFLWRNPFSQILLIYKANLGLIPHPPVYYLGQSFPLYSLPWHYLPIWILISTPLLYIFLFFMGCISAIKTLLNKDYDKFSNKRNIILFLFWFFIPLLLSKGKVYDSWRHFFFIYPVLIIIAITGFQYIWEGFKKEFKGKMLTFLHSGLIIALSINLISVTAFMIKNHPFEDFYFNCLAGRNMDEVRNNFELNYWGTPYKQALEYILKNDHSNLIPIYFNDKVPGDNNINILPLIDRKRFISVSKISKAKYFIVQHKIPERWPYKTEYYSIKVNGTKILTVFRLN